MCTSRYEYIDFHFKANKEYGKLCQIDNSWRSYRLLKHPGKIKDLVINNNINCNVVNIGFLKTISGTLLCLYTYTLQGSLPLSLCPEPILKHFSYGSSKSISWRSCKQDSSAVMTHFVSKKSTCTELLSCYMYRSVLWTKLLYYYWYRPVSGHLYC